MLIFSVSS